MSKKEEKNLLNRVKERIKKLGIKDGKVVVFERNYDEEEKRWEDSGEFYLYKV